MLCLDSFLSVDRMFFLRILTILLICVSQILGVDPQYCKSVINSCTFCSSFRVSVICQEFCITRCQRYLPVEVLFSADARTRRTDIIQERKPDFLPSLRDEPPAFRLELIRARNERNRREPEIQVRRKPVRNDEVAISPRNNLWDKRPLRPLPTLRPIILRNVPLGHRSITVEPKPEYPFRDPEVFLQSPDVNIQKPPVLPPSSRNATFILRVGIH